MAHIFLGMIIQSSASQMTLVSHSYVTIESPGYAWLCHGQLVGGFNPSDKYESQLGRIIPNIWKHQSHVPNHQPLIRM
jgi:hypothetical protein